MNKFKKYFPKKFVKILRGTQAKINGQSLFRYDKKRFIEHYSKNSNSTNRDQTNAKIIFYTHAIEKGLSHDEIRYGFGKNALIELGRNLNIYDTRNFDKTSKAYIGALSVVKDYMNIHENAGHETSYLSKIFGTRLREMSTCNSNISGSMIIKKEDKSENSLKNFEELFINRYSVRTYSSAPVDINRIHKAIEISTKTPSVCNRQSTRLHVITNQELIKKILEIQGGVNGYQTPPILIALTSDINSFIALTERNQMFIDGGLFSMALLLALEFEGLAACPLNAMFNKKRDKLIRNLLQIKPSENIIMFITVGNFKDKNNVAKSFRLSGGEITKILK